MIKSITVNNEFVNFEELKNQSDILKILLKRSLNPNASIKINITYQVKIPNARFTNYGKEKEGYSLRYWYLTPAVFNKKWELLSNLNIDDLYEDYTDFKIDIDIPKYYNLESNVFKYESKKDNKNNYYLIAKGKTDIFLSIAKQEKFKEYKTKAFIIKSDISLGELSDSTAISYLNRELSFISKYLGKFPHKEIFLNDAERRKDPILGISNLPKFIHPFEKTLIWDLEMFKIFCKKYVLNTTNINLRKNQWFIDGLINYLLIEYINEYYPNEKLLGKFSNYWPLKNYNVSKLKINDKYPLFYQFSSRKYLDQSLLTPADSLSNFNRKLVNKYKSGLSFRYLKGYLGEEVLSKSIQEFYFLNKNKRADVYDFKKILTKNSSKNIDWFFDDFLKTNKKIDYAIDKVKFNKDSINVSIKNKSNITTPVSIYGLKDKEIKFRKWVENVDSLKTITLKKGDYNKLALNYENLYPELNTLDNWKSLENKIFNKPLKFTLLKDIRDPYYHQLFYLPTIGYNFYNGLILGLRINNKPLIKRNLEFSVAPSYGTKSNTLGGRFSMLYNQYFEKTKIYKIAYGFSGINLDYAENLAYTSLVPYIDIIFKRKTLRDTGNERIRLKLVHIDKEVNPGEVKTEEDKYSVFSLNYTNNRLNIIKEFGYSIGTEFSSNFAKSYLDLRYRSLTDKNRQLDFRVYAGVFLRNKTTDDYFSFGLDRANDYLFELNYYGRSESSGIFSQQYVIAEGGFKSVLPTRFANEWMLSFNSSIGIWRWIELYNDVAFLKNRSQKLYFAYENGIRFNFVHRILELYFPLYSNNGWETNSENYSQKIRFTLTANINSIYNFIRRGFL